MIPQSLKTGLLEEENPHISEVQDKLLALVAVLIKRATLTAATFSDHNALGSVSPAIITKALKVESMEFFESETLERDMENMLMELGNMDECGPDQIIDHILSDDIPEEEETDNCSCAVCAKMRTIDEAWSTYNPDDDAKLFLKNTLDSLY